MTTLDSPVVFGYNVDMYVRTVTRKNKRKPDVTYIQLAHNYRDSETGQVKAKVLYNFGRADRLDVEAIRRLVKSLSRFLSPEEVLQALGTLEAMKFLGSRPWGGVWVLRRLWERLGLKQALEKALQDRAFSSPVEWAIFALVANRALAPASKRAAWEWVREDVALGNEEEIELQHLYRAMDFLLEHEEAIQREVFFACADLLNLEVDLIFFDTTSSYFELEGEDGGGLRRYGHSKEKRGDLPQIVIGLAVTKEGIPVRSWVLPGNTADAATVEQVQRDLAGWRLGHCVWVMDRGMSSAENRIILRRAGGHWILGEKLRRGKENRAALSRPGRYRVVRENLRVKEVWVGEGTKRRRYVVVYNPEEAERDRARRERILARLEEELEALGDLRGKWHKKAVCALVAHPTLGRYLKELGNGELEIDWGKVRAEERCDGKYLLSSSDDSLTAEEIALGYKQLLEVERAFRTLKQTLELRPIYHRKDERIRTHVTLCWLALLLVRIIERESGQSWERARRVLERIHLGEFEGGEGRILQRTELTQEQEQLLKRLAVKPPPKVERVELTPPEL
jgi:transposase